MMKNAPALRIIFSAFRFIIQKRKELFGFFAEWD